MIVLVYQFRIFFCLSVNDNKDQIQQDHGNFCDFGLSIQPHLLYSPDLAPNDFHLFRTLQNGPITKEEENAYGNFHEF